MLTRARTDILTNERAYHCTWKRDWDEFSYKFSCVTFRDILLYWSMCDYFGHKSFNDWKVAWDKECVGMLARVRIKESTPRYFEVREQLPHICSTIKQTPINICPTQYYCYSINTVHIPQTLLRLYKFSAQVMHWSCLNVTSSMLSECDNATVQKPRRS
jgi:hypothetical protein